MLNDEVSKRIRELRLIKGITQEELSDRANIDVSYMGKIERGQSNISLEMLDRIIKGLGTPYDEFFVFNNSNDEIKKIQYELSVSNNKESIIEMINAIIELDKKTK